MDLSSPSKYAIYIPPARTHSVYTHMTLTKLQQLPALPVPHCFIHSFVPASTSSLTPPLPHAPSPESPTHPPSTAHSTSHSRASSTRHTAMVVMYLLDSRTAADVAAAVVGVAPAGQAGGCAAHFVLVVGCRAWFWRNW